MLCSLMKNDDDEKIKSNKFPKAANFVPAINQNSSALLMEQEYPGCVFFDRKLRSPSMLRISSHENSTHLTLSTHVKGGWLIE